MGPVLFRIGDAAFASYFLAYALGFLACTAMAVVRRQRAGIAATDVLALSAIGMVGVLVGARLAYHLTIHPQGLLRDPTSWLRWAGGGYVLWGGLLGAPAAMIPYARLRGLSGWRAVDLYAPTAALAVAVGRVGCFLSGCCWGRPTDLPWAVRFLQGPAAALGPVHPVQLYEAAAALALLGAVLAAERAERRPGEMTLLTLAGYAIVRFAIEPFRADPRGDVIAWLGLSTSQTLALGVLAGAAIAWRHVRTLAAARPAAVSVRSSKTGLCVSGAAVLAVLTLLVRFSVEAGALARSGTLSSYVRDEKGRIVLVPVDGRVPEGAAGSHGGQAGSATPPPPDETP